MNLNTITGDMVLAVKMQPNDADAETIRDYLVSLVARVWNYQDEFNGKKPFGSSAWDWDLYEALVRADFIFGLIEDGDYISEFDREAGDACIEKAIRELRRPRKTPKEDRDYLVDQVAGVMVKAHLADDELDADEYWRREFPDMMKPWWRERASAIVELVEDYK